MNFTDFIGTAQTVPFQPSLTSALRPRLHAGSFLPLVLSFVAVFAGQAHGTTGAVVPSGIEPEKIVIHSENKARTIRLTVLVANNSTENRLVSVGLVSSDPAILPNPAPVDVFVRGKKKAGDKPVVGRQRFDAVIAANTSGVASLTAVIDSASSRPSSVAVTPSTVEGHAQFYKKPAEDLLEAQDCQLTRGRVTAYWADGSVVAKGRLSPSGSFVLTKPRNPARFRKRAAGLADGEIRVVIDLPDGSTLMADSAEKFIQVTPLTTVLSLARKNRPGLTLALAEAALRSYLDLPESLSLEDFGGELSPFSEADFMAAARAWNAQKKKPREDIDAFVNEVEDGVQDHVDGQVTAIEPFRSTIAAAPLLGIDDDNTDPLGSMDPDQFQGLAEDSQSFDINSDLFKKASNYNVANSTITATCSALANWGGLWGIIDAADNQGDITPATKLFTRIGLGAVAVQWLVNLGFSFADWGAPNPVEEGLKVISAQIEALSKKLDKAAAKAAFDAEKKTTQESYNFLLARLNTVSTTLRPTTDAPVDAIQFQQACQFFAGQREEGALASVVLANSMLGINQSGNGVRLLHAMINSGIDMNPVGGDRMDLPFRSNELLLQARSMPMRYINMLTTALQVSSEESRVYMNFYGSPAQRLRNLHNSMEKASTFGNNGLAALRRRALQQAPPRFSSSEIFVDSTRGDGGRGLVWSREVMERKFDDSTTQRKDTSLAFIRYVDGEKFKPGDYQLNDELPAGAGWRLPTLQELQSLPGWGKGVDGLAALSGQTGINRDGPRWFAAQDPSAPDPIEDQETGFGTASKSYVNGRVRFYSFDQGREVKGVEASANSGNVAACLRVLDLNTYPGNADIPTFAWPDDPARKPSWWPAKAYESSLMRAAGIPPTDIAIVDHVIPNPWYKANPLDPREVPTHVRVLSALAYWELKSAGSETRGMVEDVSGLVEWQSSDSGAAMIANTFSRFDAAAEAAQSAGKFVSPWFATITFSRADVPVTFTANWIQQLGSATPSNKVTITQAADASLCLPPVVCGLDVSPGNLKYIRASDINDKVVMSATLYRNDRSAEDATNQVVWSLLSVTKDAGGNEITAPFPDELASISQGSGGGTGGKLTVQPNAGLPARTLRVVATDPATGRTGKADLLLQF